MAKERTLEEFSAVTKDNDGDEHKSVVRAHVVTKDTAGLVTTRVGSQEARPDDVLVETSQPNVFDVLSADQWKSTGYSSKSSVPTPLDLNKEPGQ